MIRMKFTLHRYLADEDIKFHFAVVLSHAS